MRLPPISLILGGASSGKSAFAEKMVRQCGLAKVYIATAEAHDGEMSTKVARHRAARAGQGWRTVEAPHETAKALTHIESGEVALVDCVTFWLTNLMIDEGDWDEELEILIDVMVQMRAPVVLVSNDVSGGVVPENALARAFQRAQGEVNQRLAAQADLVVYVTAGLPTVLKGEPQLDDVDEPW
ncbi:bifunctional adenosylcobinamide kinase/adenosylcobinamide-phosphate guanylyltransferase [Gymnodinialimonas ceratoperidinii]|uniref:Bifunctional adenosylcobalamin biosynthesis protein n=1 Tax=Gymnodinialimonas ceratoperidinii TaxID=2856823 RepID=A0A8F6TZC5_9RHOB|nr:bifunctional adenosylcobinamide kinase/adenosylcobinamide-phosphate guanylyltransferase [Gymnodinialimonas ceratoperidinii]QXT40517.1 bifunctional adenosylcobinamide kinase/adenosylcobinamide-phosphate guanylyltransferase [Gymnodinialimonas ceratoperidinii]